jgi:nicotinate-nucleotide--dimethylbenzimidazole phosphoribosyltransferase
MANPQAISLGDFFFTICFRDHPGRKKKMPKKLPEKLPETLKDVLDAVGPVDSTWIDRARARTSQLIMPHRALGRLHDISERLCGIQQTLTPKTDRKAVLVMAGDHGIASEGVSAYPQEVTGAMVKAFLNGGAGINALSRHAKAEVWVADLGIIPDIESGGDCRLLVHKVSRGTRNFAQGQAMTREQAELSILTGFRIASQRFAEGIDLLGTGDMGIGNSTPSAAIGAVLTGKSVEVTVGRGTGIDDRGLKIKREMIKRGIDLNRPDPTDGLDVLAKVGGFEIGGIAGAIFAGAYHRKPVVVDGFISTAGALVAHALCPAVRDYLFAGHRSEEPGHAAMLAHIGLDPILDLGMRLGEGTGAVLAMSIIDAAACVFKEVATFDEAGVPGKGGPDSH